MKRRRQNPRRYCEPMQKLQDVVARCLSLLLWCTKPRPAAQAANLLLQECDFAKTAQLATTYETVQYSSLVRPTPRVVNQGGRHRMNTGRRTKPLTRQTTMSVHDSCLYLRSLFSKGNIDTVLQEYFPFHFAAKLPSDRQMN